MFLPVIVLVLVLLLATAGLTLLAILGYDLIAEHRDKVRLRNNIADFMALDDLHQQAEADEKAFNEAYASLFEASQTPPLPEEDVVRYLVNDDSNTDTRSTIMTKSTATVESVVAAVKEAAKKAGISDAKVREVLKSAGVGSVEHHTVTITVKGDTFEEVRDRAVRVITTYGPTVQQSVFPVTSDGVHFEHSVTED